ncbi:hypothetical protein BJY04DRAFT_215049 [Aspergillus karnatakaensis]|uniref:uncharacterized protein n=1 Tax=Aspergillus karnatakaensis TaxID=1810916 RepID=UPI003CCCEEF9
MARWGYFSSGSTPSCSEYAFETDASRIDIAFAAIFFLATLALLFVVCSRIGQLKKQGQRVAGSVMLVTSILFAWFAYTIVLIYRPLEECDIFSYENIYQAPVLTSWLFNVSSYLLFVAILTSISNKLQKDFNHVQPVITKIQKYWAVLIGLVLIPTLSVMTAYNHYSYNDVRGSALSDSPYILIPAMRGLWTTFYVVCAAGMLLAAASIGKTLAQAPAESRTRSILINTTILHLAAVGMTLTLMGDYVDTSFMYMNRVIYYGTSAYNSYIAKTEAASFLGSFFYCLAFYAAVQVASLHAEPVKPVASVENEQYGHGQEQA